MSLFAGLVPVSARVPLMNAYVLHQAVRGSTVLLADAPAEAAACCDAARAPRSISWGSALDVAAADGLGLGAEPTVSVLVLAELEQPARSRAVAIAVTTPWRAEVMAPP
jgi:hypothetical protein